MRIDIHVHADPELVHALRHEIVRPILEALKHLETKIMASLDQVMDDMTAETTAIAGLSTLIAGLKQQIKDALSGVTLPPDVQAKVDAIFSTAETNKQGLADALAAGTTP